MCSASENIIDCRTGIRSIHEEHVGGKARNLFLLRRYGFSVPEWFVVSADVFNRIIRPNRTKIKMITGCVDFEDRESIDYASTQIERLILNLEFPDQMTKQIEDAVRHRLKFSSLLSVRSSVVGEDSSENSFAGQMDSFLNVRPPEVIRVVKKVWASAFSPRALLYRRTKEINLADVSVAVIVQEMVQPESSGVLFTRDPETGAEECVISAGYGLGEGVVQDMIETDTYRVRRDSPEISKSLAEKKTRVGSDLKKGGTRLETVSQSLSSKEVLSDSQILCLSETGRKAERHFKSPQDIEWAFDKNGRLHVLQSRPIVFSKNNCPLQRLSIWDNSNIVESYPRITLPLTFSFIQDCYEFSFRKAAYGFLAFKKAIRKDLHIFKKMIGLLDGRVYYNLLNWYKMLSYLPGFERHKRSWDQMIGISEKVDFPESKLSPINRLFSLIIVVARLLTVSRNHKAFFRHFDFIYERLQAIDISSLTEDEIITIYESSKQDFARIWHLTLYNDFCAMKYYDWLKLLCGKWGLNQYPNLHNNLLCGEKDVESVKPVHSLLHLAEKISQEPHYHSLFAREDNTAIWHAIQHHRAYAALKEDLDTHLQEYGDRGLEELKLEKPTFREEPASLIELIRNYFQLGMTVEKMVEREKAIRENAEKTVREHLKHPCKRVLFEFVLRKARLSITGRENMRFARSRAYGIVRRLFRRMADLFVEKGLLDSASDLYYLTVSEIFGFIQGSAVTQDLKALVRLRKAEYDEFARRTPDDRIRITGIPYVRSFNGADTVNEGDSSLRGIGCSSGISEGTAWVVSNPDGKNRKGNYILVAKSTDPGWVFLMIQSRGIVVEKGSVLSHTAIIGRELGIPTIVGVKNATTRIRDGSRIIINGGTGELQCT